MEHYDVIIVGGGIAGTGLAYNLRKVCPKKSVLVIDKEGLGANAGYGYRNTTREVIEEYKIPYIKKFKGVKVGSYDQVLLTINKDYYFFDYKEICNKLLQRSNADFYEEVALSISKDKIVTSKNTYSFKHLIDCSGPNFFLKKILKQQLPFRYWLGIVRKLKDRTRKLNKNYYYFLFGDEGFLEDIYPLSKGVLHGYWQYAKNIDFSLINIPEKTLLKKHILKPNIEFQCKVIGPCTPVFPLTTKNYAFLGDSFGNATTSSAEGIKPILDSSKILAQSIRQNNLNLYKKRWMKKYMPFYFPALVSRLDRYNNHPLIKRIKNYPKNLEMIKGLSKYPKVFAKILNCERHIILPKEIKKLYPKHQKLWQFYHYISLKFKYLGMKFS